MAETVKLTRAQVIEFSKNDTSVIREFKTEKGGFVFSFRVQTRVNDRVDNAPRLFRKCSYFAKTEEEAQKIKKLVTKDALLEIEGQTNRKSFDDKKNPGTKVYYDEVNVSTLTAIQVGADAPAAAGTPEDLPF